MSGVRTSGLLQMLALLTNAPQHIDAAHVVDRKDAHRHAEVVEGLIHRCRRRAFFDKELRLAHVGNHHAIADKSPAVADNNADLSQLLRERQRRSDNLFAGLRAAHNLDEPHDVRGAEEVQADDALRSRRCRGDLVDIERRGVGGKDAVRPGNAIEFGEDLFLQCHVFEDSFENQVRILEPVVGELRMNLRNALLDDLRREASALD